MTRIEAGAVPHKSRWVHPSEIVEAARSQVEPASSDHEIKVLSRSEDRVVHVDPRLTSAALAHLLENAAQYSPPASTITVAHEVTAEGLLVTVEDEGDGIAPADKPRLFEPFYRGEQGPRHTRGHGHGAGDYPRAARRGARPRVGRESSRRRRQVLDPGSGAKPPRARVADEP